MHRSADNGIKNRLIEPLPMAREVLRLKALGVPKDRLATELSRRFYVDVDLLNSVLRALPRLQELLSDKGRNAAQPPERPRTAA